MPLSRLKKVIDASSSARRFPESSYRVLSPKDEPIGFKRSESHRLPVGFGGSMPSVKPSLTPAELEWRAMEEEIKQASFLLSIGNESESGDFLPYDKATLSRAAGFLRRMMINAHSANVIGMGVPQIGPANSGSIDLYWEKDDRTLLINFPPSQCVANFYGRKAKSEISGRFDPSDARAELVIWLAD